MTKISEILCRRYKLVHPISHEAAVVLSKLADLETPDLQEISAQVSYDLRDLSQYIDELAEAGYIEIYEEEVSDDWPAPEPIT